MKELTREIGKFLWQGGKSDNLKKFHLVNWETVCKPKIYGGSRIPNPSNMNLSLGAKIISRTLTREGAWWKEIIQKKYTTGTRKRCLDNINMERKGLPILELCKSMAHIITKKLIWTPGNDKNIKIWNDHCSSVPHVILTQAFPDLRQRMESLNIHSLFDISEWTSTRRWYG